MAPEDLEYKDEEYELLFDVSPEAINLFSIAVAVIATMAILVILYSSSIPHTEIERIPSGDSQMTSILVTRIITLVYTIIYIIALPSLVFLIGVDILDKRQNEGSKHG